MSAFCSGSLRKREREFVCVIRWNDSVREINLIQTEATSEFQIVNCNEH